MVDTVFERPESFRSAERAVAGQAHHLVAVTCELEAREARRSDRRIGQARDQNARVFRDASYALRLDTSQQSVDAIVELL